jgi:hypothetical protein
MCASVHLDPVFASVQAEIDACWEVCRFSSNVPFLKLDYPLSGATDNGISHSLYNQAPKKILYEKQYS